VRTTSLSTLGLWKAAVKPPNPDRQAGPSTETAGSYTWLSINLVGVEKVTEISSDYGGR
jgi:hypothetical protein